MSGIAMDRRIRFARGICWMSALVILPPRAAAQHAVATIIGDFEDDSIAYSIGQTQDVLRADCIAKRDPIPARGQSSLSLQIGATQAEVSAVCDLVFRTPMRFDSIDELGGFVWIKSDPVQVAFRLRDSDGREFETPPQRAAEPNRWVDLGAPFDITKLKPLSGQGALAWPVQVIGFRVTTTAKGRQTIYVDDLQVLHRVGLADVLTGSFKFDEPTRIYSPGAKVAAQVQLENRARDKTLAVTLDLAWIQPDGKVLRRQSDSVNLPPASKGFRSVQSKDFSEKIDAPGVYRLAVRARASGWTQPAAIETTIAVTPTNRNATRGRSRLFGVRTNLLREPVADQTLELALARDLGAQVVLLDTPWSLVEPRQDDFDVKALTALVDELQKTSILPAVAVVGTPEWLPADMDVREKRLAALLRALSQRFANKVFWFQLPQAALQNLSFELQCEMAQRLQADMADGGRRLRVLPPAIDALQAIESPPAWPKQQSFAVRTSGTVSAADRTLTALAEKSGLSWNAEHWWEHQAQAIEGSGSAQDAVDVLRHYISAAAGGVGGAFWFDLRDDDNDPANPKGLAGLVGRDFSPKMPLLGYMSAAGVLNDLSYAGPIFQAPAEFESAIFISSNQQVGILVPRPNRILPAVVALLQGVPGEWSVQQFDRSPQRLLATTPVPLVATAPTPLYLTLKPSNAQPKPQIGCAAPWIRAPATVFTDEPFVLEILPPQELRKGFYQFSVPADAPYRCSASAGALSSAAGELISIPVKLTARPGVAFEHSPLPIRLSVHQGSIELTLDVRPGANLQPLNAQDLFATENLLAELASASSERPTAQCKVYAGYAAEGLTLGLDLQDDKVAPADGDGGDRVRLGIAAENADEHFEIELCDDPDRPDAAKIVSLNGRPLDAGWIASRSSSGDRRKYVVKAPASALAPSMLSAGSRLLLSARYADRDAPGASTKVLMWGGGLDGSRSSADFRWVRLAGP